MSNPRATILVIGQANAANHGPVRASGGPAVRAFHEGSFLPAHDPIPGASGGSGSVWTRFGAKAISSGLCKEVVFVNVAHGDTAVADWAPGGAFHFRLVTALRKARDTGVEFTHVVWFQGERDTLVRTAEADYADRLGRVIAWLRTQGIDAPVFVCRTSRRGDRTSDSVRRAQDSVVDPRRNVFAGPDSDMLGPEMRTDGTQLNADGQEAFADMLVEAFAAAAPAQARNAA